MLIQQSPKTPCEVAHSAADRSTNVYNKANIDSVLKKKFPDGIDTFTVEKGFAIYQRYKFLDPDNRYDTTYLPAIYADTATTIGTAGNIEITMDISGNVLVIATLHTHPSNGYAAQSVKDIFLLLENYSLPPTQKHRMRAACTFAPAYNGDTYSITVTDSAKAIAFLALQNQYLEGTHWNKTSEIGKVFDDAYDYFKNDDPDKKDFAYEMAMATVLTQFNAGVILSKRDTNGDFKPLVVNTSQVLVKQGRKSVTKTIYTPDCL